MRTVLEKRENMTDLNNDDRIEPEQRGGGGSSPVTFTHAKGSLLYDEKGKAYIDFYSRAGTLNYGHNNESFKAKAQQWLSVDNQSVPSASAKALFIKAVEQHLLAPRNWNYILQFTGLTVTCAVEAALKIARQRTGRQNVISFTHGLHDASPGTLTTPPPLRAPLLKECGWQNTTFMPYDGYLGPDVDTVAYVEGLLADPNRDFEKPAAIVVETIQGGGGVNVATQCWLKGLEQLCHDEDILLIVDETRVGCGRTGRFFSFEVAGIEPDIIALSSSALSSDDSLSLIMVKPGLQDIQTELQPDDLDDNHLAFTMAAHVLNHYWADPQFGEQVLKKEELLRDWLENIVHSYPGSGLSVRGRGLIQGLVTPAGSDLANEIAQCCLEAGLLLETVGADDEVLKLLPALTIDEELLTQGLHILEQSVATVMAQSPRTEQILK